MVESHSLFTWEIDDAEQAVQSIQNQLANVQLRQNTIGIISCHYDYIEGGIAARIIEALPFPAVGYSTFYQAVPGHSGMFECCITVLTSDDVSFGHAYVDADGAGQPEALIRSGYAAASAAAPAGGSARPALLLAFLSAVRPVSGDTFLSILDDASGGVPAFGAAAISDGDISKSTFVLGPQGSTRVGFVLITMYGGLNAHFCYGNFSEDMMFEVPFTVTGAQGDTVSALNGESAVPFLRKNGMEINEASRAGLVTIPILHRRPGEEVQVARTLVDYTEAGEVIFYGEIPEGSTFRLGFTSPDRLVSVTKATAQCAVQQSGPNATYLMFSCVARYISMGLDFETEMKAATGALPESAHYLASYAGGEICPVYTGGRLVNRYHNGSFIVCMLE